MPYWLWNKFACSLFIELALLGTLNVSIIFNQNNIETQAGGVVGALEHRSSVLLSTKQYCYVIGVDQCRGRLMFSHLFPYYLVESASRPPWLTRAPQTTTRAVVIEMRGFFENWTPLLCPCIIYVLFYILSELKECTGLFKYFGLCKNNLYRAPFMLH